MNLSELSTTVDGIISQCKLTRRDPTAIDVGIVVSRIGVLGQTPCVDIESIQLGFDWDNNKCLIRAGANLRESDRDEISALQKKYDALGWQYYESHVDPSRIKQCISKFETSPGTMPEPSLKIVLDYLISLEKSLCIYYSAVYGDDFDKKYNPTCAQVNVVREQIEKAKWYMQNIIK